MKVRVKTGYRADQQFTIDAEEAHKAYYLFLNPDQRGIFSNGIAVIGADIKGIEPDWHATMGWNPTHHIDSDDWNEINGKGIGRKLNAMLAEAKSIASTLMLDDPGIAAVPLSRIARRSMESNAISEPAKRLAESFRLD